MEISKTLHVARLLSYLLILYIWLLCLVWGMGNRSNTWNTHCLSSCVLPISSFSLNTLAPCTGLPGISIVVYSRLAIPSRNISDCSHFLILVSIRTALLTNIKFGEGWSRPSAVFSLLCL